MRSLYFTSNSRTRISVEENVANGTVIFQVKAKDADHGNNSIITYTSLPGESEGMFSIDASSGNITVTGQLDHENTSEVILRIQATDGKFQTITNLSITILDVNEFPPVFDPQSYQRNISEATLVKVPVIQVFATDKDSGKDSRLFYNITSGSPNGTFSINAENGTIFLQKSLDYETKKLYELHVEASDGIFSTSANVSIFVVDSNDNSPVFDPPSYQRNISETFAVGEPVVQVNATDEDSAENSRIFYNISSGDPNGTFSISAENGTIVLQKALDYETKKLYELHVEASDGTFSTRANVSIHVVDSNDNSPVFDPQSYQINISETFVVGEAVIQVNATDKDSGENKVLFYNITSGNPNGTFRINTENGTIFLQESLDYEMKKFYELRVGASDGTFSNSANVSIYVVDYNDNSPVFDPQSYQINISEMFVVGEPVIQVFATDKDSRENNRLFYNISSGNSDGTFSINAENGTIVLQKSLDYEMKKLYELRVEASDGRFSTSANVSIHVDDYNDNSPVFTDCKTSVTLQKPPEPKTMQVFRVSASDADHGSYAEITYSIVNGNDMETCSGGFVIDGDGRVFSQKELSWDSRCNISIRATDGVWSDVCSVDLRVKNEPIGTPETEAETGE